AIGLELQSVDGAKVAVEGLEGPFVREDRDVVRRLDPAMVAAVDAHLEVAGEVLPHVHVATLFALVPDIRRDFELLPFARPDFSLFPEPSHACARLLKRPFCMPPQRPRTPNW